ncbi:MAG: hypothetical protein R2689_13820 [Microthrixaceae bacterium]
MEIATDDNEPQPSPPATGSDAAWLLAIGAVASIGAGAIHAVAVGAHSDHRQLAISFTVLAIAQLAWGAATLVRRSRPLAFAGVAVGAAAVGGWVLAVTSGIGFVDGLEVAESPGFADSLAAALAGLALIAAVVQALGWDSTPSESAADTASTAPAPRSRPAPGLAPWSAALTAVAVVVIALTGTAMSSVKVHSHGGAGDHADGHDHGDGDEHTDDHTDSDEQGDGHDHADGDDHSDDHSDGSDEPEQAVVPPNPYDPNNIDLSGIDGLSDEQVERAETLVSITVQKLPKYADQATALADGFVTIGDAGTGFEHLINWGYINDDRVLDPDYPESLVYQADPAGGRTLVSAMFMLWEGATFDDVPDIAGNLTQWHIHDDLCFSDDPTAPRVAGVTSIGGTCTPPLVKFNPTPMIHVWITPHPCGPFAALEGVAGGQVPEGETKACLSHHSH